eukprot:c23545_g1_i2 orf=178-651(+)
MLLLRPVVLSCARHQALHMRLRLAFAPTLEAGRSLNGVAAFSSEADGAAKEKSSGIFSWFDKVKGVFKGKTDPAASTQKTPAGTDPAHLQSASSSVEFTLITFADEIKKARRVGSFAQFGVGLPRGGEAAVSHSLERQETIARAIACYNPTALVYRK